MRIRKADPLGSYFCMKNCLHKDTLEKTSSISVALCTFNGSRFLAEQLQSIAAQTVLPSELVICDDGSTDETLSILNQFAENAPFQVQLFQNEKRLGPAENFEKAICACNGEVIFLCDQDDIWETDKVEHMMQAFEANPTAAYAFSNAEMIGDQSANVGATLWDAVGLQTKLADFRDAGQVRILLKHNVVTGATMAFRKSFRELVLPIPSGWMHDYWIVLLGSSLSYGVPVPECLMKYRRHASQVCGWRKMTFWQVVQRSLNAGTEDWTGKVANFRKVLEHLNSISGLAACAPNKLRLIREKEHHLAVRSKTRASSGFWRIAQVLAEATTGRYQRFSDSWYSIVRDL